MGRRDFGMYVVYAIYRGMPLSSEHAAYNMRVNLAYFVQKLGIHRV